MRATDRIGFRPAALSHWRWHWLWRMGPVEPNAVEPDTGKHTAAQARLARILAARRKPLRLPARRSGDLDGQRYANHSGGATGPGLAVGGDAPLPAKPANTASTPGNNAPCQANSDKRKRARKRTTPARMTRSPEPRP